MSRTAPPARELLRALRTGLSRSRRETDPAPLLLLARQALTFIEQDDPAHPDTAAGAAELAYLLASLLANHPGDLAGQGLGLLFRLGVVGEILATAMMLSVPEDRALALAEGLTDEDKLLFANAFFRRPRPDRPLVGELCQKIVADAAEQTPDDLLVLLDLLASRREYPPLPLRNLLVRGRLGIWLQRLLLLPLSADEARYLAGIIGRLRDPALAERLAAGIGDMDAVTAEIVCRTLAEIPGLGAWAATTPLEALLADADPLLAMAALAALARCDATRAAKKVAALAETMPGRIPELAPALAGLSQAGLRLLLQTLPPRLQPPTVRALYGVLATAQPERLDAAARAVIPAAAPDGPIAEALQNDLAVRQARVAPPGRGQATVVPDSAGPIRFLTMEPQDEGHGTAETEDIRQELAAGASLSDRTLTGIVPGDFPLAGLTLRGCRLQGVGLGGVTLRECVFKETLFSHVDWSRTRCDRVLFRNCRFDTCRFAGADLQHVHFIGCRLRFCTFAAVTGRQIVLQDGEAEACDFDQSNISGLAVTRVWLRGVNLTRMVVNGFTCQGTTFTDCILEAAVLTAIDFSGVATEGCYCAGLRLDGTTDAPELLEAADQTESLRLEEAAPELPVPEILAGGPGLELVREMLDAAFGARDIRRRWLALLANNTRRIALSKARLGKRGGLFLDLLPELVTTAAMRDATGIHPAPAGRIDGYSPLLPAGRLLAGYFGKHGATPPVRGEPVRIEALYAIGSVGTVAQTTSSDLDVWVCLAPGEPAAPPAPAFQEKLDAIRQVAGQEYGLDVNFFCMTAQDIRDNIFGFSEDEGQGSAQGCLLKEEFYRTVLVLAGRKPAWWCAAPGATPEEYGRTLDAMARTQPAIAADSLDCGSISALSGDAFFGASLWMIVKSLTSPFKSILKFGLLEKYAEKAARPELLCETLKASLVEGQSGMWRCDPYALLFAEVSRFYVRRKEAEALTLLRQAFQQKTGFDPWGEYTSRSGAAMLDRFFPYAPQPPGTCPPQIQLQQQEEEKPVGFPQVLALGDAITKYFLHVYKRLWQRAAELPRQGGLTERDYTMLSHRITASFGRQTDKVMRLPFIRPGRDIFLSLEIDYEERASGQGVFAIRGQTGSDSRKEGTETWDAVRSDASLVRLAGWLAANELYRPGTAVRAVVLPAPLALSDVRGLCDAVHATFPIRETFAPPLSWGLAPKSITAALVVLNLGTPREERDVARAEILYATSWGELLHMGTPRGTPLLESNVPAFLAGNLKLPLARGIRIEAFAPARSQCRAARQGRFGR